MGTELMKIAEGFSLVAEGILGLAKVENSRVENDKTIENQSDSVHTQDTKTAEKKTGQPKEKEQKISIEDIRAILAEKSQDGKSKEVKALLNQYGVAKLSAVEEKDYPEFLQKAKVL